MGVKDEEEDKRQNLLNLSWRLKKSACAITLNDAYNLKLKL